MTTPSNSGIVEAAARVPPGGHHTILLGEDGTAWSTTSNNHSSFPAELETQTPGLRKPPGGVDSVQLGGPVDSATAEELLARPSAGGADSIVFGRDNGESLPAAQLLARASVGGADSVDFGATLVNLPSEALLARPSPGGSTTVVLGGDTSVWTTNSQAHGVGGAEAAAVFQTPLRPTPGGVDSVNFAAEPCKMSLEALLARPSPGGADTMDFSSIPTASPSTETLLTRAWPGGSATVVLGADSSEWTTNSQVHGVGSVEAVAVAETPIRPAPGGADSINFGAEQCSLPSEVLLARPSPGGETKIMLGGDKVNWATNSSTLGTGSVEAIAQAQPRSRPPPGGAESVQSINASDAATWSAQELLARPATGGKASVLLGGDINDWITSSDTHATCDIDSSNMVERQAPGGYDSVVFGAVEPCRLTLDELHARPAPGGADSVDFSAAESNTITAADLLARPFPGGHAKIILGTAGNAWATTSQTHDGTACELGSVAPGVRPPPGGMDSVGLAPDSTPSVETLLARPAPGGAATVVLGGDGSSWAACGNAVGIGCNDAAEATARPATAHSAPCALDSIDFGNAGDRIPTKPLRMMSTAIGGNTTVTLGDMAWSPEPGVSANRFACGSNQNQGNCITDRSTTRLHQAPGGNSSINLCDGSSNPVAEAPASANRFACGSNQNQGNWITDRSSTRLHHAPGGFSSINLGDDSFSPAVGLSVSSISKVRRHVQDENTNCSNIQQTPDGSAKKFGSNTITQAPGGNSSLVLG